MAARSSARHFLAQSAAVTCYSLSRTSVLAPRDGRLVATTFRSRKLAHAPCGLTNRCSWQGRACSPRRQPGSNPATLQLNSGVRWLSRVRAAPATSPTPNMMTEPARAPELSDTEIRRLVGEIAADSRAAEAAWQVLRGLGPAVAPYLLEA
jgi:hypothetical protein